MTDQKFQVSQTVPVEKEEFLAELEDYMKNVKKLSKSSVRIYLNRIRRLLENQCSVEDLCGASDLILEDYGPQGQKYDPKDHGNTRAAIRHVDDFVRMQLLKKAGNLFVSFERGWDSFREKGKYESGYTIQGGMITFSYHNGFSKGKDEVKKISTTNLKQLIVLFERAYAMGCFASSGTCISTIHGSQRYYNYAFADLDGSHCCCLFEGDGDCVNRLTEQYAELLHQLRA